MQRIKTNIIELDKLFEKPCSEWLDRFIDGKLDAHEAFKKYGQKYHWLYENSQYDLIGWEIENDCFDWEAHSWAVAQYCPEKLNPQLYNWRDHSRAVAQYCPDKLDPQLYNWRDHSRAVAQYCPDKLDPQLYNWERESWAVAEYCPEKLDPSKFNWKSGSLTVAISCPDKLDPLRFNWQEYEWAVTEFCPEKLKLKPKKNKNMETKINIYKINGKTYYGCAVDGKKVIKDTAVGALFELGVGFIDLLDFFDGKVFSKLITSSIFNAHIDEVIEINGRKFRFISAYQPEPKHL